MLNDIIKVYQLIEIFFELCTLLHTCSNKLNRIFYDMNEPPTPPPTRTYNYFGIYCICEQAKLRGEYPSVYRTLVKRVCNENLIFLFPNQNICYGYSKELSQ